MAGLNDWLKDATRHLSSDSAAQVRIEIQAHYESEREAAMERDATGAEEAGRLAVFALGDAKVANREYRKVLLTRAEAKALRDAAWETQAVCSRPWLKWLLAAMPVAALSAATAALHLGATELARILLSAGVGVGLLFATAFFPIRTPSRGRIFRPVKWVLLTASLVLAFGPDALKWSWLLASCLWPLFWIEWTRVSIRRKLPVEKWPKQLYF